MKSETAGNILALAGVALAAYVFLRPAGAEETTGEGSLGGQDSGNVLGGNGPYGGGGGGGGDEQTGTDQNKVADQLPEDVPPSEEQLDIPGNDQIPDSPPGVNPTPEDTLSSELVRQASYGAAWVGGGAALTGLYYGGKAVFKGLKKPKTPELLEKGSVKTSKDVMKTEGDLIQEKANPARSEDRIQTRKTVVDEEFSMSKNTVKDTTGKVETKMKTSTGGKTEAPTVEVKAKDAVRVKSEPTAKAGKAGRFGMYAGGALVAAQTASTTVETFQEDKPLQSPSTEYGMYFEHKDKEGKVERLARTTGRAALRVPADAVSFVSGLVYRPKSQSGDTRYEGQTGWFASEKELASGAKTLGKETISGDLKGSAAALGGLTGTSGLIPKSWKESLSEPTTIQDAKTEIRGGDSRSSQTKTTPTAKLSPPRISGPKTGIVKGTAVAGAPQSKLYPATTKLPSMKSTPLKSGGTKIKKGSQITIIKKRYASYAR